MQFKKLTIGIVCGLGLTITPMVSQAEIITLGDGSQYDISLQSHVGNAWTYSVSEVSGKSLSHWNLGIKACMDKGAVVSTSPTGDVKDGSTDFEGMKWDVDESFTSGTFSITLDADYPETTILAQAKAGKPGNERTGNVSGPDCSGTPVTVDKCDYIYAVDDQGLNNSQLLRYTEQSGIETLGQSLGKLDIEALDISPEQVLFGASGDDTKQPGYLYTIDMTNGSILSEGATGCNELDGISFNPADGSLWGWDQGLGLVQIIDGACSTSVVPNKNGYEVEDLTWDNAGKTLYFAYNNHGNTDPDAGNDRRTTHRIGQYSDGSVNWNVCEIEAPEIEALEMLNDDTLLVGYHDNDRQFTRQVDLETCTIVGEGETSAYDIEGLAVCLPEVASCPSIAGTWTIGLDVNCDDRTDVRRTNTYSEDFTWNVAGFPNGGPWSQEGCNIEMEDTFFNPSLIWNGTMGEDGSLSGTYSGAFNGCWTATRASGASDGIASASGGPGDSFYSE